MTTAPRFRRQRPVEQYGTADLKHMTPEEIATADQAGHFDALNDGRDPDATVNHKDGCTKPPAVRHLVDNRSIRLQDPVRYRCTECGATKEI